MSDSDVIIQIRGDVADINAKLSDLKGHIGKVTDESKKMGAESKNSWAMVSAGIAATIYNIQQLIEKAQYFTNAFMEAETATMKLAVAMRNQGDYSKEALKDLEDYAKVIQDTTAYEDDHVVSVMANLKTYGMTNEEVKKATQTVLDFTTAKRDEGMSVERAGDLLGKAYVGNTERLKRFGIIIDEGIPKAQKYEAALKQLNERFGGAAQADLETYAGRKARLHNQLKDIAEFIGHTLLKLIGTLNFSFSILSVGFWTMIEGLMKGVTWLSEKIADFAEFLGMKKTAEGMRSFVGHMKESNAIYTAIKEEALKTADANYKVMMSFDNVDKAVMKMKPGKRFIPPDETDKKAESAREAWAKAARDIQAEIDKEGLDPLEKSLIDIDKKIAELMEKAAKLPTATERKDAAKTIDAYKEAEINKATTESARAAFDEETKTDKARLEMKKKLAQERKAVREAEIQGQLIELEIEEKYNQADKGEILKKKIILTQELKANQEEYLATIDRMKDPTAWRTQESEIKNTHKALLDMRQQLASRTWTGGAMQGLNEISEKAKNVGAQVSGAVTKMFDNMTDALTDFVMTGKMNFTDFANSVIKDLIRIYIQQQITGPLAKASGSFLESLFSNDSSTSTSTQSQTAANSSASSGVFSSGMTFSAAPFHGGGNVGGPFRFAFDTDLIPRRHGGGLAPYERLVVNKVGERYVTEEQNNWLTGVARAMQSSGSQPGSVSVSIKNESGQSMKVTDSKASYNNMRELIIEVVIDAHERNAYGLRDRLG